MKIMKIIKFKYIVSLMLVTAFMLAGSAMTVWASSTGEPPRVPPSSVSIDTSSTDISGIYDTLLTNATITLNVNGDGLEHVQRGDDATTWFNVPSGITAEVTAVGATSSGVNRSTPYTITFSGKTTVMTNLAITVKIPKEASGIVVSTSNPTGDLPTNGQPLKSSKKWDILPAITFSAGTLNASGTFVSGTAGGTVTVKDTVTNKNLSSGGLNGRAKEGNSLELTATPSAGYKAAGYMINDVDVTPFTGAFGSGGARTLTQSMPGTNVNIKVVFEKVESYHVEELEFDCGGDEPDTLDLTKANPVIAISGGQTITIKPPTVELIGIDGDDPTGDPNDVEYTITFKIPNRNTVTFENNATALSKTMTLTGSTAGLKLEIKSVTNGSVVVTMEVSNDDMNPATFTKTFTIKVDPPNTRIEADGNTLEATIMGSGDERTTEKSATIVIDFDTERISIGANGANHGFTTQKITHYSTNGGTTWTAFSPAVDATGASISAILDKTNKNLQFTWGTLNSSTNKPPLESVWTIGNIVGNRPAAPKITVVYGTGKNNIDMGYWSVTSTTSGVSVASPSSLVFATAFKDTKGKEADTAGEADGEATFAFTPFPGNPIADDPDYNALIIKNLPASGKVKKFNYLFKTNPAITVDEDNKVTKVALGSRAATVKVSSELKAPKGNVNYKKELVVVKKNMMYRLDEAEWDTATAKKEIKFSALSPSGSEETLDVTVGKQAIVFIRTAPTAKKPWSKQTEIKVHGPKRWEGGDSYGEIRKGKLKLMKGLEVWNDAKRKWVRSVKPTAATEYRVRQRGNAKYNAKDLETNLKGQTASEIKTLTITWGDVPGGKNGKGVQEAKITP